MGADIRPSLDTARTDAAGDRRPLELEGEAHGLADRLPDITVEALRIASTVAHGIHGRRRAGPGETFWQFRQYERTDSAALIDWRRSASSDHLYVREREWEAAHTIWLWPDLSASMRFRSDLSRTTKQDRALVLTLAAAELLVRGGERVGLLGLGRPTASRRSASVLAERLVASYAAWSRAPGLPPAQRIGRYSGVVLIGDFLDPPAEIRDRLAAIAGDGISGHLIQVLDPAEESLPYDGRAEFLALEGELRWTADRVEGLRGLYRQRLEAHRAELRAIAGRLGWSFLVHHTDKSAAEPLLNLLLRLGQGRGSAAVAGHDGGGAP